MESLYGFVFNENPLTHLNTRLKSKEEFCSEFLYPDIELSYPTDDEFLEADKSFPEEIGDDFNRHFKGYDTIMTKYPSDDKTGSNVIVVIGHGSMVYSLSNYIEKSDKVVDYCSIGCIEYDRETDNKQLILDRF